MKRVFTFRPLSVEDIPELHEWLSRSHVSEWWGPPGTEDDVRREYTEASFVAQIFSDPSVTRIHTDPSPTNQRAIRCYEKACFVAARIADTPGGRGLLMYCDRTTA